MLNRKRFFLDNLLLSVLISIPCYSHGTEITLNNDWLSSLEGSWRGEAVHTPVGPTPYNVNFNRVSAGCVSGTAYTGFSNHTWTFCPAEDGIILNFLSDFRGNRDPVVLKPIRVEQGEVVFKSAEIAFMDVILARTDKRINIDIMHYDRLHVRIVLTPDDPGSPH